MTILLNSLLPFFSPFDIGGSNKHQNSLLNLDLQFFAKDGEPGGDDPGDDPGDKGGSGNPGDDPGQGDDQGGGDKGSDKGGKDEKLFTQEQVNKLIKDRVARAIKDKEEAIKEAEKLAKMNAEQKREYELEKLRRENEELKKAQTRYELGREATKMLAESGIVADEDVLSFVVRDDAEQTQEAVKIFTSLIDKISDKKMKEKLKGKPPRKDAQPDGFKNPFSKEHFNLTEQGRLLKTDPDLYKQLKAQANLQ
ncbi:mannitol/fructose-specific phosphotransferase system IIA component (Ntr-type) [Bacillus thermophilus]|uniref:Mannitol/fructose-specific phosphotransferase system IIA component (Ntr-type) n=1 Tax=Siminovitchia thermophila TaxID=1245522 RepID=A0ABS2RBW4_9BACI|nr:DUF4355 domain-containing protein [Siminovitchia thermophila]MBM7717153.1 mannitol/fructose-specific phosphotransferase system IIA component (Ntr-type) [Siminovitchia thermophila]